MAIVVLFSVEFHLLQMSNSAYVDVNGSTVTITMGVRVSVITWHNDRLEPSLVQKKLLTGYFTPLM